MILREHERLKMAEQVSDHRGYAASWLVAFLFICFCAIALDEGPAPWLTCGWLGLTFGMTIYHYKKHTQLERVLRGGESEAFE